ncbi:cyclohexanone monooxygenase [Boeremia exigua]|uniref:cyclohexanone monooxygenase n=1 Tax=Boeremia exigua TaxID=749465 RepID=UPI001E8CE888|nr:cyclohexanone monooxygenase [Boeremia exigua]KAH6644261.1 cyclohexanone monooxygenase [Boeremia exigua]
MSKPDYDAIIVGAGFGGIYQLYSLRQLGLKVLLLEAASDIGGTWYWNRYPGASSDVHSFTYRYSWDKDLLQTWPWKNSYLTQPEVQAYLSQVVDKHDLRQHIQLNTKFLGARFDEQNGPEHYDFRNKRVGIVGNGSTGSQLLVALSKEAKHVTSFQQNPQWNVPNGNRPVTEEERASINENYSQIWDGVRNSSVAFGFAESTVPTFSVDAEERQRRFQAAWEKGNGFYFMFGVFSDITTDRAANDEACAFIRSKIEETVKDPETARKLIPTEPYARRPICNNGYYETFNRDNVNLVSLKQTPFAELTPNGARTTDGEEHLLDVLIFATGFDAVTGSYDALSIVGKNGESLKNHWAKRPSSYLGFSLPSFPNLFTLSGPHHPFTNAPPQIEAQVEFITDVIKQAGANGVVEATKEAEDWWTDLSNNIVKGSIFHEPKGWVFKDNVEGKEHNTILWFGGLKAYREHLDEVRRNGFKGYEFAGAGTP